jgi:hypothetical protein
VVDALWLVDPEDAFAGQNLDKEPSMIWEPLVSILYCDAHVYIYHYIQNMHIPDAYALHEPRPPAVAPGPGLLDRARPHMYECI